MNSNLPSMDFTYCLDYINKAIENAQADREYEPKVAVQGYTFTFQNPSLEDVEKVSYIITIFQKSAENLDIHLINSSIKSSYPDIHKKLTITDEQGISRPCTPHDLDKLENQSNVILLRNLYFSKCFFFILRSRSLSITF